MYSAPGDYLSTAINITFSPGSENRMCVNITVNEDQVIENPENFSVIIERNIAGGTVLAQDQSEVRVLDSSGKSFATHALSDLKHEKCSFPN